MGQQTAARCDDCGYVEGRLFVGGSPTAGFRGERWPCLCLTCRRVVSALINWETLACSCGSTEIEPYGSVSPPPGSRPLHRLRGRVLEDAEYPCPQCGAVALRFADGANAFE